MMQASLHGKPDQVEAFIAATFENGRLTRGEPGNLRFHVLEQTDDPARFLLLTFYPSQQDAESHCATEPREAIRYRPVVPGRSDWFS